MTQFVFVDFFLTTLSAAVTSGQTSISVASATNAATVGGGQQWAIVVQSASTATVREVMYVTAISGTTFTVTRAQEGTTAQTWGVGDHVFCSNTSGQMGAFGQLAATQTWSGANTFSDPVTVGDATTSGEAITLGQADATFAPIASPTFTGTVQGPNYYVSGGPSNFGLFVATGNPTLNFLASNYIQVPAAGGSMAFSTGTGSMTLNSSGQLTLAAATSSGQAVNLGQFINSFGAAGYAKMPGGLVLQWGVYGVGAPSAINFPTAFPNACFAVMVSEQAANGTWGSADPSVHGASNISTTGYDAWALKWTGSGWTSGSISQGYLAIGY
jgi:Putative tail fiber protein gp53-like, C-terminal